jgi:diguanylate cyclase (GGDEF)-like protein
LSDTAPVAAALAGRRAPSSYVDHQNRHWLTAQAPVTGTGWTVLVEQPEAEVLRPAERAREQMLVLLLLIGLVTTPALIAVCHGYNRPVQELAAAVRQMENGIYDAPLPSVADTDLSRLIVAFDAMRVGRRRAEAQLEAQAWHDSLTGLPNRLLLHDRLDRAIRTTNRFGEPTSLLFLDLDGFKHVNDSFGHPIGDRLLVEIGNRLTAAVRASDTVARLGGDEFAVLLLRCDSASAMEVAQKLRAAIVRPAEIDGQSLMVDVSIGAAVAPQHGDEAQALMQHADMAMYAAKASGGGAVLYSAALGEHRAERMAEDRERRTGIAAEQPVRRATG